MNSNSKASIGWAQYVFSSVYLTHQNREDEEPTLLKGITPVHLASIVTESTRLRDFCEANFMLLESDDSHWALNSGYVPGSIDLCEKYGHVGDAWADGENGYEEFQCVFCGWGFSCYH